MLPPARKRQATVPTSCDSTSSATANNLLLQLGMPLSIRQLVCDLLDAVNESSSNLALTSVKVASWDLTQMKTSPESFLFDRTCPKKALDDTCLFGNTDEHLFGRKEEMRALMMARNNVSENVHNMDGNTNSSVSAQGSNFLCEAAFVRGYAGSGKSSLLQFLFDRTCPKKALDDTCLFGNTDWHCLFGRDDEMDALTAARNTVSEYVHNMEGNTNNSDSRQGNNFLCEAAFLRGYAGSGKSSLLHSLINVCNEEQWFVLGCKFDKQAAPIRSSQKHSLFGREEEMKALMMARNNVSEYIYMKDNTNDLVSAQGSNFICETAFLRGYAGSGKSTLLHSLINVCNEEQWFVLGCKFDKQSAPHTILAKAFDDFFGKWGGTDSNFSTPMMESFHEVCRSILETIDNDGFDQLRDLMPNFARLFPLLSLRSNNQDQGGISSMDKVGSANKKRTYVFHVLLKSLCSAGRPVLLSLDDLQWSQS
eukprot:CAMPEP_0172329034 /NCGR_PEP_ID=MMETSP1058-20130122/60666_1 /TAXON_ID=83371 /ORGANISM="Detonula confervacea, Strain CCMP 353" /LENGTH=478 /DNA_ID=CAMNT_0013046179 /DNA_START=136 /DNA_END=1569 /DNA_ORIENTATION=+